MSIRRRNINNSTCETWTRNQKVIGSKWAMKKCSKSESCFWFMVNKGFVKLSQYYLLFKIKYISMNEQWNYYIGNYFSWIAAWPIIFIAFVIFITDIGSVTFNFFFCSYKFNIYLNADRKRCQNMQYVKHHIQWSTS